MSNNNTIPLQLLAEIPGLMAAKDAINARIEEIRRHVGDNGSQLIPQTDSDPTYLGRDTLGRVVRKRTLTPEVREKKRELIAKARQSRLDKIKQTMRDAILAETPQPPPPPPGKKLKNG